MQTGILNKIPFLRGRLDSHMQEVVGGATVALALKVMSATLAFGFNVLLARLLGAEGAGAYFLALTAATVASIVGRVGLDNSLLRFVASNAAVNDWASVNSACKKGIALAFAGSALTSAGIFAAAPLIAGSVFSKPDLLWPIRLVSFSIVPFSLLTLYAEMLKGLKRIFDASLIQGIGVQGLSVVGLWLVGRSLGVNGAILAYIAATVFTCLAGFWLWKSAISKTGDVAVRFETREIIKSSIPLFWVSAMNFVINMAPTFMLGVWGTKADIGIFGVASRTAMLISFILIAANSIVAPKFAALYRLGEMDALGKMARSCARLLTLLATPVLLLILLFPSAVMSIFGGQFHNGGAALSILAMGQFVNVATGSVGYLLMMSGNERLLRNNMAYMAAITLMLNLFLIPRFGVTGAAVATAVSVAFQNLSATYLVYRKINIVTIP